MQHNRRYQLLGREALAVLLALGIGLYLLAFGAQTALAAAPTITAISPSSGLATDTHNVTITGTNFVNGSTTVTFGAAPVTVTNVTSNSIALQVGPSTPGKVNVTVVNPDGSVTVVNGFEFTGPPPVISNISPNEGSTLGGTQVTITGTGFTSGAQVRFGNTAGTNVTVSGSTQITVRTPARGTPGAVDVTVQNSTGGTATVPNGFTYVGAPAPTITGINPGSGTTGGGTPVTITGTGFAAGATVHFANSAATSVQVVNQTTIHAVTPARSAGAVVVKVTNPDGKSAQISGGYTYIATPSPVVSTVTPSGGPAAGGNSVTITGSNFLPGATVRFGNNTGTVTNLTSNAIIVTAPSGSGTVAVRVTNTDGKSDTKSNAYTYAAAPTITSISPDRVSTAGGGQITINGNNYGNTVTVTVNGVSATNVTRVSATRITANVPPGTAGLALVVVENPDGQKAQAHDKLTYVAGPTISNVTPNSGPTLGGTSITINGSGFVNGATVRVGGNAATSVVVANAGRITAVVPAGTLGSKDVEVLLPNGINGRLVNGFTYTQPTGVFVGDQPRSTGLSLVIFSGGSNAQLQAAANSAGCSTNTLTLWVTVAGKWVGFIPAAQLPVVNAAWNAQFPNGVPANQVMLVRCG